MPDDARVVDLTGREIAPGSVGAQIRFFQSGAPHTRLDRIDPATGNPRWA